MNIAASRSPWISVVAACILSGGLIAAATIDSQRGASLTLRGVGFAARGNGAPPISQEVVWSQFRQQFLDLQQKNGYTNPADVKMNQIDYSAKDDTFTVLFDRVSPSSNSTNDVVFLHNNGYGQYYGQLDLDGNGIHNDSPYVTIK